MRIEYETTPSDLEALRHFYLKLPHVRHFLQDERLARAAFPAFAAFIVLFSAGQGHARALAVAVAIFVAALLFSYLLERRQHRLNLQLRISLSPAMAGLGKRSLEISEDTLTEGTDQFSATAHWSMIKRIAYCPRHVFFIFPNHSAFIIPLETITPATDRERFLDFLRRCAPPDLRKEIPEQTPGENVAISASPESK